MTVYATRTHIGGSVGVSDAHGGCGERHDYIVGASGYPEVTCAKGCEEFLRKDSQHATSPRDVPMTYDEQKEQESLAKQGTRNRDYLTSMALARIAGVPAEQATLGLPPVAAVPAPPVTCPAGHTSDAGQKFCATCGASLTAAGMVRCPDGHESPGGSRFCGECGKPIAAGPVKAPSRRSRATAKPAGRAA